MSATSSNAEQVTIAGPAGSLEAIVEYPQGGSTGSVVVCHPHPVFGGTLHNKVAYTLARVATALGRTSVRFNFRGVGASEGHFDEGRGETEDVLAVAHWAREAHPGPLWLAGFSFGACMAVHAAPASGAVALVLVAPAVERYALDAEPVTVPLTLAQGMADEVVNARATVDWARRQPGLANLLTFDKADHFFHGAQVLLRQRLLEALGDGQEGT